jgi:hypothetical protein
MTEMGSRWRCDVRIAKCKRYLERLCCIRSTASHLLYHTFTYTSPRALHMRMHPPVSDYPRRMLSKQALSHRKVASQVASRGTLISRAYLPTPFHPSILCSVPKQKMHRTAINTFPSFSHFLLQAAS